MSGVVRFRAREDMGASSSRTGRATETAANTAHLAGRPASGQAGRVLGEHARGQSQQVLCALGRQGGTHDAHLSVAHLSQPLHARHRPLHGKPRPHRQLGLRHAPRPTCRLPRQQRHPLPGRQMVEQGRSVGFFILPSMCAANNDN